jgi:endo-beta-N-acetylglucosaminidase D
MYNDFKSLNYEHSLITEALKENPEIKDYNFYEFFLKFRENDKKDNFIDSTTILIANNRLLDAINKFNKELFDK